MDSETSGYVEKAAFSEYFCKMAFCALYRTGSIFGSNMNKSEITSQKVSENLCWKMSEIWSWKMS